jgi:hypothetical protein
MTVPLLDQELDAVLNGSFELHSLHMTLSRPRTNEYYEGAGYIRTSSAGDFEYRLYDRGSTFFSIPRPKRQRGQLLTDDDLFTLNAIDPKGRTWKAAGLQPSYSTNMQRSGVLWTGHIHDLAYVSEWTRTGPAAATLLFRDRVRLPAEP